MKLKVISEEGHLLGVRFEDADTGEPIDLCASRCEWVCVNGKYVLQLDIPEFVIEAKGALNRTKRSHFENQFRKGLESA